MPKKQDVEAVRLTAQNRWTDTLQQLGGLSSELLDGKHHPCPKCGGTDRFRLIDAAAGALHCNQCFNSKNGDGFAALQWLCGWKFPEAVEKVAEHLGVSATKQKADPAQSLKFQPWSSGLAAHFCKAKGISEAALIAANARIARYAGTYTVIAFPIIGSSLDVEKPVGWVIANFQGGDLPKFDRNRKGEITGWTKYKITYGSGPGFVGAAAVAAMQAEGLVDTVWKTEGMSDMLALYDAVPEQLRERQVVLTNANGAGETPKWMAGILAAHHVKIIHDADEPGQAGAKQWAQKIAEQQPEDKSVRNVQLPYKVEPKKGKDVRDYLAEGNRFADLEALAEAAEPVVIARTETGEVDYTKAEYPLQELILKKLQIEVLYEEEDGAIRVFSTLLRKASKIRQVDRLRQSGLVQICGPPAMECISRDPDLQETFSMDQVQEAIALAASTRRGKHDERGVGVWQGIDDFGNETETVVLVNDTDAARWNGDKVLRKVLAPRCDGLVLDFGSNSRDWFDFETLDRNLEHTKEPEWVKAAIDQAEQLFQRWQWKNPEVDPMLITGLVLASWVQTVWAWRPLVSIVGESNSGKSYLFEALGGGSQKQGLFGKLAFMQAKSSEPGLRQGIGNTALIAICDEFEKSKDRERILEMFRLSTRGQTVAKGTGGAQKGKQYQLRHIGWVASIEGGLLRSPDANRFVQFELKKPKRSEHGKLSLPEASELQALGQKLLAIAVANAIQAKRLAVELKRLDVAGIDARTVESYAVPAAILATARGFNRSQAETLLQFLLGSVEKEEQGRTDQEDLLDSILAASIHCGSKDGVLTVGQLLEPPRGQFYHDHASKLEAAGVRLHDDGDALFFYHQQVARVLLRQTPWEGQRIDTLLLRLPGAKRDRQRVSGRSLRGVTIPTSLCGWDDGQEESF